MGFSIFTPSYMYLSPSGYIFRLRIPADLKPIVGKCEFRYSLRSGILSVAKIRAQTIASYLGLSLGAGATDPARRYT